MTWLSFIITSFSFGIIYYLLYFLIFQKGFLLSPIKVENISTDNETSNDKPIIRTLKLKETIKPTNESINEFVAPVVSRNYDVLDNELEDTELEDKVIYNEGDNNEQALNFDFVTDVDKMPSYTSRNLKAKINADDLIIDNSAEDVGAEGV